MPRSAWCTGGPGLIWARGVGRNESGRAQAAGGPCVQAELCWQALPPCTSQLPADRGVGCGLLAGVCPGQEVQVLGDWGTFTGVVRQHRHMLQGARAVGGPAGRQEKGNVLDAPSASAAAWEGAGASRRASLRPAALLPHLHAQSWGVSSAMQAFKGSLACQQRLTAPSACPTPWTSLCRAQCLGSQMITDEVCTTEPCKQGTRGRGSKPAGCGAQQGARSSCRACSSAPARCRETLNPRQSHQAPGPWL